jgi:hypothetical protein
VAERVRLIFKYDMTDFTIVLTSSVLAAGLTSGVNYYLQRNNFKNDYYKKVIDYRIKAYEQIWELLNQFPFDYALDDEIEEYFYDAVGNKSFDHILSLLADLTNNGYWLTDEMRKALRNYYYEIGSLVDEDEPDPNERVRLMIRRSKENQSFKDNTSKLMFTDMSNLHDVAGFLKAKNK